VLSIRTALAACVIVAILSSNALARQDDGATINTSILLIQFHEQPLSKYSGGIDGLEATSRAASGHKLDPRSPESLEYLAWLRARQDEHLAAISARVGRQVDVIFRYDVLMNGVAIRAEGNDYSRIKVMGQVKAIGYDRNYPLNTDRGPQWIGAPGVWDGSETGGLGSTRGEGIVVGDLDTGVNFGHPSYSDNPDDGHNYVNPNGSGNFLGWCNPGHPDFDPAYTCNDKLIGAWDYADAVSGIETDGPVDDDGHGSHTSSTAAGNTLSSPAISGVAPHANLIMYDVCYEPSPGAQDTCPLSATSAAAQQALIDGVDVINFSIGGGATPWSDMDIDSFFLDLVANGAFVSTSAGNSGPNAATVGHIGPWVSASGASTHDRTGSQNMLVGMSGGISPPADITGQSRTDGYGPETVVYAGDFSNGDPNPEQCINPFPADTWTGGEIVLCDRGSGVARVIKCANVANGGAGGCILADSPSGGGGPVADPHIIPAIHVDLTDGNALRGWLGSGSGHMGEITASTLILNPAAGDIMASFSSRGPAAIDVIKPDLTNPGVNIFAAYFAGFVPGFNGPVFNTISGTSMASPHTAGSAALLKSLHPTWTPPEVKSALMTTADTTVLKEDGSTPADPFDRGGGRVQLGPASRAGLVLDETEANFLAANPETGGDPRTLNLATMMNSHCATTCYFTRTVKNARSFPTNWTFSDTSGPNVSMTANPSGFGLASGATQEIEFAVTITGGAGFVFGEGTFTEDGTQAPPAHFTAAVQQSGVDALPILIESLERTGMHVLEGVVTTGASNLQLNFAGVVPLERTRDEVAQDPTNGNPYDNATGTVTYLLTNLVGARRIHASTLESDSPDLDLYVGRDANMDGIAQANEQVCVSGSSSAEEECDILDPQDGDWWVLVQNWQGSGNPLDSFTIRVGVVDAVDQGNFAALPSDSNPGQGETFDVTVNWDFGSTDPSGYYIGVLDWGTSPGNEGDLGTIRVDFFNDRIDSSGFE